MQGMLELSRLSRTGSYQLGFRKSPDPLEPIGSKAIKHRLHARKKVAAVCTEINLGPQAAKLFEESAAKEQLDCVNHQVFL